MLTELATEEVMSIKKININSCCIEAYVPYVLLLPCFKQRGHSDMLVAYTEHKTVLVETMVTMVN